MGSHRVGHNWSDLAAAARFICCYLFAPPGSFLGWETREAQHSSFYVQQYQLHGKQLCVSFPRKLWKFQPLSVGVPVWVPLLYRRQHYIMSHSLELLDRIISRLHLRVLLSSLKENIISSLCVSVCVCVCVHALVGRDSWHTNCPLHKSSGLKHKPSIRPSVWTKV